jgi:predicted RNase H-like HicB family nuclease
MDQYRYRVLIRYDQEKHAYLARTPELEHCTAEGDSAEAALTALQGEIAAQVQNMQEAGQRPPRPIDEQEFGGELTVKLSSAPVNQIAGELLGKAIEQRLEERPRRRRPPVSAQGPAAEAGGEAADDAQPPLREEERRPPDRRGGGDRGGRDRYHAIMDDRANFIEYVRSLETGGGASKGPPRKRR